MPQLFRKARDPFSSYSHFVGAVLSGAGLFAIIMRLLFCENVPKSMGAAAVVFCLSLIALYSASSVYHFSLREGDALKRLKKLDHSMIYVLIAGSYTPIVLKFLPAPGNYIFLFVIWSVALAGILIKLLWIDAPRGLGTALYLILGWSVVFRFSAVLSMPAPAIALLAAGGIAYTTGGVIYIIKKPDFGRTLGFHEVFHLFVIAGSVCHYIMIFLFVL